MNLFKCVILLLFLIVNSSISLSAGSSSDSEVKKSKSTAYLTAQKLINKKEFARAIEKLNEALSYNNKDPDIYNYLGFSYRKLNQLDKASSYYNKALEINPKHKGALEYQGEMFITLNQIKNAENNLKKLDKICFLGCSEFDKLKKSIENAKKGIKNSY